MAAEPRTAIIIGAGPAGLTAALQLLRQTDIRPIVIEASDAFGGISRTVNFKGYRMDIGGHRFFSKSDWVMKWWQQILPLGPAGVANGTPVTISYRNSHRSILPDTATDVRQTDPDRVMLLRNRLSRIYFLRKFFDYPLRLNIRTVTDLGLLRVTKAAFSYAWACIFPRQPERSLEDFLINRFGRELYRMFFRSYTEKVWGVPCSEISAEWGAQRIKGLSLTKAVLHALKPVTSDIAQQEIQTSLIERFLYPKFGPGQLWEEVAARVRSGGGEIRLLHVAERLRAAQGRVTEVTVRDLQTGALIDLAADYVISTMPVKDLVASFDPPAPEQVRRIADALPYRDFITVGLIVNTMRLGRGDGQAEAAFPPDNWIYIHEPGVRLGRLQIFNNWSPSLVADATKVWLGLEYFCNHDDDLWKLSDDEMRALAINELEQIDLIDAREVVDAIVIRVPKTYPAYFGAYAEFDTIRSYVDPIANLFLIGRNGMHRYNNQDHSMLTAKAAVDNIASGRTDKSSIWSVNVDGDYQEEK